MSTTTAPTRPSSSPAAGLGTIAAISVVAGAPVYFTAFLVAYGFEDSVGIANHAVFLAAIGVFAAVTGLVGAVVDRSATSRRLGRSLALDVPAALSLNAAVVAVGSVVSALNKDQNSVSAGFSTTTDVLVAAGLAAVSVVTALVATRAARR